jgi:hypothetical protein
MLLYRVNLADYGSLQFVSVVLLCFLIRIVGVRVQLGSLGTVATNMPIVPAPGDYDDGEIGGMD